MAPGRWVLYVCVLRSDRENTINDTPSNTSNVQDVACETKTALIVLLEKLSICLVSSKGQ